MDTTRIPLICVFACTCIMIIAFVILISWFDRRSRAAREGSSRRTMRGRAHESCRKSEQYESDTAPRSGARMQAGRDRGVVVDDSMPLFESTWGEKMCKAAANGDLRSLRTLIVDKGASVNAGNYDGRRALHLAAAEGHREVVKFLLQCRVDVNAQDRWGGTPLQDARQGGHTRVAELLLRAGAACSLPSWSARIQAGAFSSASTQGSQPLQMYARLGCWAIASDEINLVGRIDQGSQGTVYKAAWRGKAVAVKVFQDSHVAWDDEDQFENEIVVMSTLRHPNLVLFLGAVLDGPKKMLVTEYLEQGSLLDLYVRMWHTSEAPFLPRVEVLCSSLNSPLLICGVPSDLIAV